MRCVRTCTLAHMSAPVSVCVCVCVRVYVCLCMHVLYTCECVCVYARLHACESLHESVHVCDSLGCNLCHQLQGGEARVEEVISVLGHLDGSQPLSH